MHPYVTRFLVITILAVTLLVPGMAAADPISKTLTVQVYTVCDDFGTNCASSGFPGDTYFATEVNKIWAQAGIGVNFNFVQNINSTQFSYIDDSVVGDRFNDLAASYGTHGPSSTTLDMFLVHTIVGAFGEGWVGWGGVAIGMDDVMSFNSGQGRLDTVAHELGHNFGLFHDDSSAQYLMASGGIRSTPLTMADIAPDGLGLDLLTAGQITTVLQSSLLQDSKLTPEPASIVLVVMGLVMVIFMRKHGMI